MFRFYSKGSKARVTVVGDIQDGVLKIAASRCSDTDAFCKRKGVEIASRRLSKGKTVFEQPVAEEFGAKDFVHIASTISQVVERTKGVAKR